MITYEVFENEARIVVVFDFSILYLSKANVPHKPHGVTPEWWNKDLIQKI